MPSRTDTLPSISPTEDAFLSSGSSPTLHLLGAGKVGRAFLELLPTLPFRLTAVSDSTATVFGRDGLDPRPLAALKAGGRALDAHAGAANVPLPLLLDLVAADVLVDATPSDPADAGTSAARTLAALRAGRSVVLARKDALLAGAEALTASETLPRLGLNAVLGGTGLLLKRELPALRERARAIACVPNATTTTVLCAVEAGATLDEGLARARERGLLESDPSLDLSGADARLKLSIVGALVLGRHVAPELPPDLRDLDPDVLLDRRRRGATTRLVGRVSAGGEASLRYEELPAGSPLAVPGTRVAYVYETGPSEARLHVGSGVGAAGAARALVADLLALPKGAVL